MTLIIDDGPCTITSPAGIDYTAGGGWLTDDCGVLYVDVGPGRDNDGPYVRLNGPVTTWRGEKVGTFYVTGLWDRWSTHGERTRMAAIHATIDGKEYHGRLGYDWNQSVFLRRCKER